MKFFERNLGKLEWRKKNLMRGLKADIWVDSQWVLVGLKVTECREGGSLILLVKKT